ncbi:MAG: dTDP-4-dehydrorhamnose 3,5-epimerase family protein [Rhodothermales bacterium]
MSDPIQWKRGDIQGCTIRDLELFTDERGWLAEFFRKDELPEGLHPRMGYVSLTHPGVTRGPHEHEEQTDLFLFFDGYFRVYLWDARADSPTHGYRMRLDAGAARRAALIVPPRVVHAYRNVGDDDALIVNCPNRLYAGENKQGPVDEIRHEDRPDSPFKID